MADTQHPRLVYLALDARDAETAGAALRSSGWEVTTCLSSAHARRILLSDSTVDLLAIDPKSPGIVELVAMLASRGLTTTDGVGGVFLRRDADPGELPSALRDPGIVGAGTLVALRSLARRGRDRLRTRVSLSTTLRVAWLGRANISLHVALDRGAEGPRELVIRIERGEPVDARAGDVSGLEAVMPLVPGTPSYGKPGSRPIAITAEYETSAQGATLYCGMGALLDLLDDEGPVLEIGEEETANAELFIESAWSMPPPEPERDPTLPPTGDGEAFALVTHAAGLDGVMHAIVVDASGRVEASLGDGHDGAEEAMEVWAAVAQSVRTVSVDDVVEGVVISSARAVDVLRPLAARVLHVSFARELVNPALAWHEVQRLCGPELTDPEAE